MRSFREFLKDKGKLLKNKVVKAASIVALVASLTNCAQPATAHEIQSRVEQTTGVELTTNQTKELVREVREGNEEQARETVKEWIFASDTKVNEPWQIGSDAKGKGSAFSQNGKFSNEYRNQKDPNFDFDKHGYNLQHYGCHYMTNINNVLRLIGVPDSRFTKEMFTELTKNAKNQGWIGEDPGDKNPSPWDFFIWNSKADVKDGGWRGAEKIMSSVYWMIRAGSDWKTDEGRKMWMNPKNVFSLYKTLKGSNEVPDLSSLPKGVVAVVKSEAPKRIDSKGNVLSNGYHFMGVNGNKSVDEPYAGTSRTLRYQTGNLRDSDKAVKEKIDNKLKEQGKSNDLNIEVRLYKPLFKEM